MGKRGSGKGKITRREFNASAALGMAGWAVPGALYDGLDSDKSWAAPPPATPQEWTLESARKEWQPMTRAVAHVGVPGYEWQAGVLWDGSLVFGPLLFSFPSGPAQALLDECAPLGNHFLHLSVGYGSPLQFLDRAAVGNPAVQRGLEEGKLPLPHVRTTQGDLAWDEGVFAHLLNRKFEEGMQPKTSDILVVHARFTVTNSAPEARTAHLWLHFGDTSRIRYGYKTGESDSETGVELAHRFEAPLGILENQVRYVIPPPGKGKLRWHDEVPAPDGIRNRLKKVVEWEASLEAKEEATMEIILPYGLIDRPTGQALLRLDSDELWDGARRFWKGVLAGPASITTPDTFVNEYAESVVGQMAEQIGYRHKLGYWMLKTSPNHYENYWPCNAAKALPTLDMRGLTRYSRPVLKSFLDTQTDDVAGLTIERTNGKQGQVTGEGYARVPGYLGNFRGWSANIIIFFHGVELWALAAHYRVTRDREWLGNGPGSPLQAMLDACDWIATQRRRTMREENGKKVPHWGLLPSATTDDWLSGNTIGNDTACIFGMIETVHLLQEINHLRAEELMRELRDYRSCVHDRYREARDRARPLPLPDGTQLPYVPRDIYELDWATMPDWGTTRFGPVRAGAWGALDPHDELVDQAIAFLDAGMPKGEGFYLANRNNEFGQPSADANFKALNDPTASRHYLWKHYVEYETMWPTAFDLFLQRDDLPRFFEAFFNYFAISIHQGYRGGVETLDGTPSCAPGESERWRALRAMFVNEWGGHDGSKQSLWLLQAIPRPWLKVGNLLAVREMGTHFGGKVTLELAVRDANSVVVSSTLDLVAVPGEIRMRLRSGDGRPLAKATVNGRAAKILAGDTIQLPAQVKGKYQVVGTFRT